MRPLSDQRSVASERRRSGVAAPCSRALATLLALSQALPAVAQSDEFLLVRRSMQVQTIRLVAITDQAVEYFDPADVKPYTSIPLDDCIALLNPRGDAQRQSRSWLVLADGQRLPGEALAMGQSPADALAWNHPWLGRMDVPLDSIFSVQFKPEAKVPSPGQEDVVLLANGDKQEGIVVSLGDPIQLDVPRGGRRQVVDIQRELVAAVTMVAQKRQPAGRRIWFDEGTIIDVQSITVGDDGYVGLTGSALTAGTQTTRVRLSQIAAILLDPKGMVPLATLNPTRVEGPSTRYVLPKPVVSLPGAPLNLSPIEYRGPIVVRYAMPAGAQRFTAEAELPRSAQTWGDVELVVRSNDDEVFRGRLNAASPTASINVPLTGRELTIELLPGAHGPIQDRLVLTRAMVLKDK